MADPLTMLAIVGMGTSIAGGIAGQQAANEAAAKAQQAANFNAKIIERDVNLLENQRTILNKNQLISNKRKRMLFGKVQGEVVANYAYAGIDVAEGTPMRVLRENARELEYELTVDKMNNYIANMQINDAQTDARLTAELTRMEGGATAGALRARGTQSLLSGFGSAARFGYSTLGGSYTNPTGTG